MKLTVIKKTMAMNKLQTKAYCSAGKSLAAGSRICGCGYCGNKRLVMKLMEGDNVLAQDEGDVDYLNT